MHIGHGDPDATAEVVVTGEYEVGMQDQAFLGPESGLAVPAEDGGVDLYVATQWLHVDRDQVAACLGLPRTRCGSRWPASAARSAPARTCRCRSTPACSRCTPAPVKMVYGREESFFGHVHRHPARMRYEHGATEDGRLVYVRAGSCSTAAPTRPARRRCARTRRRSPCGPYDVPNALIDSYVVYTEQPAVRAMRGFGAVQACFAYESQMDKLAAALGMDPVELRIRNALAQGASMPTGQSIDSPAPVAELLAACGAAAARLARRLRELPGGVANTTHGEGVRRGVGYGVGIKNVGFSEGFDDYSTARVRLSRWSAASRWSRCTPPRPRSARAGDGAGADRADRARRRAGASCCPPTRRSARPARPRRRARPT